MRIFKTMLSLTLLTAPMLSQAKLGERNDLHELCLSNLLIDVQDLLAKDTSLLNSPDHNGMTPLHFAAGQGYKELASYLINRGASLNARDLDGETPLHHAVLFGHTELVRLLLRHDAAENIRDQKYGELPLHKAVKPKNWDKTLDMLKVYEEEGGFIDWEELKWFVEKTLIVAVPNYTFYEPYKALIQMCRDEEFRKQLFSNSENFKNFRRYFTNSKS